MKFIALPTETVAAWRRGEVDSNGQAPIRVEGDDHGGLPCRHCLGLVPAGAPYLIVGHRPFGGLNPYTECGPIFVCAEDCPRGGGDKAPAAMLTAATYIVRGYSPDERIVYGTGGVIDTSRIPERCAELLERVEIAFVHVRSASNNCYYFRVER